MTEFERILLPISLAYLAAFLLAVWLGKKPDNTLSWIALCGADLHGMILLVYELMRTLK